jgi:hypothetical protein
MYIFYYDLLRTVYIYVLYDYVPYERFRKKEFEFSCYVLYYM